MNQKTRILQVYYEESQHQNLIFEPYFNKKCTVFFENWIIKEAIQQGKHLHTEYFGVVSHKFIRKTPGYDLHFETKLKDILNRKPEVVNFSGTEAFDPIAYANQIHPKFAYFFSAVLKKIGYTWSPQVFRYVFNYNHFIAKSYIYEEYVNNMLIPAMEVMNSMPELMSDAKYPRPLPAHLEKEFGVNYYPFHAFLCERLFSFYARTYHLNCINFQ